MSGKPKHAYPGWGLDLWYHAAIYGWWPSRTHPGRQVNESEMLCVREVAMLLAMDDLTDRKDWHIKVFDDEIAAKWRKNMVDWPDEDLWTKISNVPLGDPTLETREPVPCPEDILNDKAADYCIAELREKADYFKRTGIIPVLDATFTVVKSDVLVPGDLHDALRKAFARLQADQAPRPDWHPDEMVQHLVHPSMYPLIYGRSRFFEDEVVGVDDAVDTWAGKGDVMPRKEHKHPLRTARAGEFLSDKYQWLPANLEFTATGGVKFTSYINNLHPTKYRDIYATIERLVEKALPMWDQCLVSYSDRYPERRRPGRCFPRLNPRDASEFKVRWDPPSWTQMLADRGEIGLLGDDDGWCSERDPREWPALEREAREEWRRIRKPGQVPVTPKAKVIDYNVDPSKTLGHQFKDLQIIVKMVSIELTPEKPNLSHGRWHVAGQMNEHIVATALYYVDSQNISANILEFCAPTTPHQPWRRGAFDREIHPLVESTYGVRLGGHGRSASPCVQYYGSVFTNQGRLVAFPNVFQHRVSSIKLADPSKPGHHRFIALFLVNPLVRIINTGNVPPQQAEWWEESAFDTRQGEGATGSTGTLPPDIAAALLGRGIGWGHLDAALEKGALGKPKLPNEVLDMVREELRALPMSRAEAEEHRLKLMQERPTSNDVKDGPWHNKLWCHETYSP